ncbi:hypothetical protein AD12_3600 [Escherichia coli 1-392-07_S4_C2]|nr:hypothetical protein AD12_3600 [Escherichia coli 1-392-07_S4_C2]
MDGFLFLFTLRLSLRHAVRRLYDYFKNTNFECHPDKTQTCRTKRWFV